MQPITREDKITRLLECRKRAEHLGHSAELKDYFDKAVIAAGDEDKQKAVIQMRQAALINRNPGAMSDYHALVVTNLSNMAHVRANGLTFFNQIDVRNGDVVTFKKASDYPAVLRVTGPDGGWQKRTLAAVESAHHVQPTTQSTDLIEHIVMDFDSGDQTAAHNTHLWRLEEALVRQRDRISWARVKAATTAANFDYTNANPLLRTLNLHADVDVANIPVTNKLVADDNDATSLLRKQAIDKIIQYIGGWNGLENDIGQISLGTLFVPSLHTEDWITQVDIASSDNALVEQIFTNGYMISLGKHRFNIVGDPTLTAADGLGYFNTSQPIGNWYNYVDRNAVIDETTPKQRGQNRASMGISDWYAAVCPEYWRPRAGSIKFRGV
jgi:hypothetical protein